MSQWPTATNIPEELVSGSNVEPQPQIKLLNGSFGLAIGILLNLIMGKSLHRALICNWGLAHDVLMWTSCLTAYRDPNCLVDSVGLSPPSAYCTFCVSLTVRLSKKKRGSAPPKHQLSAATFCHHHAFKLVLVGDHACVVQVQQGDRVQFGGHTAGSCCFLRTVDVD